MPPLSDDTTPRLGLPYLMEGQAQKHVTVNEGLRQLDDLVQLSVLSAVQSVPPTSPAPTDRYLVPVGATGAWDGHTDAVAIAEGAGWRFVVPKDGWRVWISDAAELRIYDGAQWRLPDAGGLAADALQNLPQVGVGTTADAQNPLSVAGDATLLTHTGAGHQLKLNKAAAPDTASLLFQTGWSGRAEMGTTGSDAFAIKVSPDGATFHDALVVDPGPGRVRFPSGAEGIDEGPRLWPAARPLPVDRYAVGPLLPGDMVTLTDVDRMHLVYDLSLLSSGTTIELPLGGTVDAVVDWGDGTQEAVTTSGTLAHTYPYPGVFDIHVTGTVTRYGGNPAGATALVAVPQMLSSVTNLNYAFRNAAHLKELPPCVSGITSAVHMCLGASAIEGGVRFWDTSALVAGNNMLRSAGFDEDIARWDLSALGSGANMLSGAGISVQNYDRLLIAMAERMDQTGLSFGAANVEHGPRGGEARDHLVNVRGWTIVDGGPA